MKNDKKNFLAEYWDKLFLSIGLLSLVGGVAFYISVSGVDPEDAAGHELASYKVAIKKDAVPEVDMTLFAHTLKGIETPAVIFEPAEKSGSFLASERRVFCEQGDKAATEKACGLPIPFGSKECPFCKAKQPVEVKVALDSDGDGIPDEVEIKLGLNPNDASDANGDLDGDGFTNMEEIKAKTDLKDPTSHPDKLDFLSVQLPLKETLLPFFFEKAIKTPSGVKFVFRDPKKVNDYGQKGTMYQIFANEAIGKTGFIAKSYEQKSVQKKIAGASVSKNVDVSTATIERATDKKRIVLTIQDKRFAAVDIQAKLFYSRGGGKEFIVVPGDEINLQGTKYKVVAITREGKTAKVTLDNSKFGKRTLEALEQ